MWSALWRRLTTILLMCAALSIGMAACVTIVDVVGRYVFSWSLQGVIELSTLFIAAGVVLSMPVVFSANENIAAELVRPMLARPLLVAINVLSSVTSIAFIALLTWMEFRELKQNWGGFRAMPDTGIAYDKALLFVAAAFVLTTIGALLGFREMLNKGR